MALTIEGGPEGFDLRLGAQSVGRYLTRPATAAFESPRPFAHPLLTTGGVGLTDLRPEDHRWHHGLSLAVPSVNGWNLWGGGSWDRGAGEYLEKDDHGSMSTAEVAPSTQGAGFASIVSWADGRGNALAIERRSITAASANDGWTLDWRSRVRALTELRLGSPGSSGRAGAGYGGLFLRAAPEFRGALGRTDGTGGSDLVPADDLLGTVGRWFALSRADGVATIVLGAPRPVTWFVRSAEYPGFGPAPFFADELHVPQGDELRFDVRMWAVDGVPGRDDIERVFASVQGG